MTGPRERAAHVGTFDAERWWRPADLAALPSAGAPAAAPVMDELLALGCAPGDLLVTRAPRHPALREHLGACGITVEECPVPADRPSVPVERLVPVEALRGCPELEPWAVLADTCGLADRLGRAGRLPPAAVAAQVNSKTWSNALVTRCGWPGAGTVVRSVPELVAAVADAGPDVLVKDPYGVSGRATLDVRTPAVLGAITRTLDREVRRGRRIELLVQEKFAKRCDFSGHLQVDRDGGRRLLGVQVVHNRGFRYVGSGPATPRLRAALHAQGYPDVLAAVAEAVAAAGYWGPVGVDGMVLADGTVLPVLEINARRSLGRLGLQLDDAVRGDGVRAHLWQVELTVPAGAGIGTLAAALDAHRVRYAGGRRPGVLLLGGSALAAPGGRVHCGLVCRPGEDGALRDRLLTAAASVGMTPRGVPRVA